MICSAVVGERSPVSGEGHPGGGPGSIESGAFSPRPCFADAHRPVLACRCHPTTVQGECQGGADMTRRPNDANFPASSRVPEPNRLVGARGSDERRPREIGQRRDSVSMSSVTKRSVLPSPRASSAGRLRLPRQPCRHQTTATGWTASADLPRGFPEGDAPRMC